MDGGAGIHPECNPLNTRKMRRLKVVEAIRSKREQVAYEIEKPFRVRTKGKAAV